MFIFGKKNYSFKLKKYGVKDRRALNTSRYNLLIFVDKLDVVGDMERHIIDIANGLIKRNVNVVILASSAKCRQYLESDVEVCTLNILNNKLMPLFMKIAYVRHICAFNKVDIIFTTSADCAYIAKLVAKTLHIKFITYINKIWDAKDKFCKKHNKIMLKSDLIILPSLYIYDYILEHYDNVNHKNMKLIRIGVDTDMFNIDNVSDGRKMEAIKYLGEDIIGKHIFLCPSEFNDFQGQMFLLDAIARLIEMETKKFICILVGDFAGSDDYRHSLVEKIKRLGIEKYVLLLNVFDDMPALYSLSYAVLSLSSCEVVSIPIIAQAGAMYRPAIVTYACGLSNCVVDEKSGYIVHQNNSIDICNAMEALLRQNAEQYENMCKCAYKYSLKYFDVHSTIISLDDALFSLIN